jgi:hypothetical protein
LELPLKKREEGRLKMEMMERNIVTANTLIGLHVFNLYDWLMLAYKRQTTIFPLKERKEKMRERDRILSKTESPIILEPDTDSSDEFGEDSSTDGAPNTGDDEVAFEDSNVDGEFNDGADQPLLPIASDSNEYGSAASRKTKDKKHKGTRSAAVGGDSQGVELTPLRAPEPEPQSNISAIFNQINVYLGVGDSVAEDADWFNITFKDRDSAQEVYRGRIAVSMSIVPAVEYENDPVGSGRNEPNKDPYLPPPNGRLSFSLNPMTIFYELCSPRVICALACCLCCTVIMVLMMLIGTQLSGWLAFIEIMKGEI